MDIYDEDLYVPIFTDKSTRSQIQSAQKTGRPCQFYMYYEPRPSDPPIVARGTLSQDGTELCTTYTMPDGVMGSFSYDYQRLKQVVIYYEELDELVGRC